MSNKKTALVTGANKGLGYEIAAGLGALGYRVAVGSRDRARGEAAVKTLQEAGVDAFAVALDVTDDRSVAEAAIPIRLATLPDGGPTGSFQNDDGVIPW